MSDRPESDTSERVLEEIFRHAEPRPEPSPAARERAYGALQGEWRQLVRLQRQRRVLGVGLAAALVLALAAGTLLRDAPPPGFPATLQAEVMRSSGPDAAVNGVPHSAAALAGLQLRQGDHIATPAGSRLALDWGNGGSLRLDEATRLRIEDAATVRLQSGTIYYDSTRFGHLAGAPAAIVIATPIGRIRHVGTQFQVSVSGADLAVYVREGDVRIDGDRVNVTLAAGDTIELAADGRFQRGRLRPHDPAWQWVADIAPELALHGRTTDEVLQWIARETGLRIRYRSAEARRIADSEPRGIGTLAPMPALRTIPFMTSLDYAIVDGTIAVDVAPASDDGNPQGD